MPPQPQGPSSNPEKFLAPNASVSTAADLSSIGGSPAQQAFGAEYNLSTLAKVSASNGGNSAGVSSSVGSSTSGSSTTSGGSGTSASPSTSSGGTTPAVVSNAVSPDGTLSQGMTGYNQGTGWWLGVDHGIAKFSFGTAGGSAYITWDGTTLTIVGGLNVSSLNIPDTTTANSFHVDTSGNTWWGANVASGLAAAPASVDDAGNATFSSVTITGGTIAGGTLNTRSIVGIASLNKKAFTNFETASRYVSTVTGSGTNTFGNQGVTLSPGTTGTGAASSASLIWGIGNVLTNNPTFTCTLNAFALTAASGSARGFIGIGSLSSITGTNLTFNGFKQIGFWITKESGVVTIYSQMNNGGTGTSVGTSLTTIVDGDIIELMINATSSQVEWFYRKNGGSLVLGDTQTTVIPTASGESNVIFCINNNGTPFDCKIILQCAAYEH